MNCDYPPPSQSVLGRDEEWWMCLAQQNGMEVMAIFNLPWRNEPPPPRNKGSIRPYQGLIGYFWGGTSEGLKTPSIRPKGSGRRLRLRGQLRPRAPVVVSPPLAGVRAATSVWVPSWLSLTVASAVVARRTRKSATLPALCGCICRQGNWVRRAYFQRGGKTDGEEETSQEIAIRGIDGEDIDPAHINLDALSAATGIPANALHVHHDKHHESSQHEATSKTQRKGPSYPGVW